MGKNIINIAVMTCALFLFGCKTTSHSSNSSLSNRNDIERVDSLVLDVKKVVSTMDKSIIDKDITIIEVEYDTGKPIINDTGKHPIKKETKTTINSLENKDVAIQSATDSASKSISKESDNSTNNTAIDTTSHSDSVTPLKHIKNSFLYAFLSLVLLIAIGAYFKFRK